MEGSISRRSFLQQAAWSAAALALGSRYAWSQGEPSEVVTLRQGKLRGELMDGIRIFRGIPFAQSPVGKLRFRPPQKAKGWSGVREALHFAPMAMQNAYTDSPHSEDCLYLNIWAPKGKGPFPVYVWIHGGGFVSGGASGPMTAGDSFARAGVIQVNVAYRLGVLGFMDVSPILGPGYAGSANNALRDVMLALEWVKENIEAFGGDPQRVTIGGESAGAKMTCLLLSAPAAQSLFQQAISESGGADRIATPDRAAATARGFAEEWKQRTNMQPAAIAQASARLLMQVQNPFLMHWPQHFPLRAQIDGQLLKQLPIDSIAQGSAKGKRLLIGTNREESVMFIGAHPRTDPGEKQIGAIPLDKFKPVFERYQKLYPDMTDEMRRIRALSAEEYWIPSLRVADAHAGVGGPVWMYMLTFGKSTGDWKNMAYHSLDLPLVFDKPQREIGNAEAELVLARQMHAAWTSFLRGEAPSAAGLPVWPEYRLKDKRTMMLDEKSHVDPCPYAAERELWKGVLEPTKR